MQSLRPLLLAALAIGLSAPALAQKLKGDDANSVYSALTTPDTNACAASCAADGLCLGWTFSDAGACELKGAAPSAGAATHVGFAELRDTEPVFTSEAPQPSFDDSALLGGIEDETPSALRPRLGAAGTR